MRTPILIVILMAVVLGCARPGQGPVAPDTKSWGALGQSAQLSDGPYRLYGEWTFYINAAHDRVDVVPKRQSRFHLNALKFLESYCSDCLQITNLKNNGDSTVDLTVKITHPFPEHREYTGFDVKGILMFNGSWLRDSSHDYLPYPEPFRVSWRKLGDPEVLNADGYTVRWSPSYDSGLPQPIFNYWEGKYATGVPTANVNAYLDFYTDENRHMFEEGKQVTRTYHIWLPPGQPVVAGYAVEACWEPPTITPVTDPANDFPITANQPEAYRFYLNVNNGQVITEPDFWLKDDPSNGYMYSKQWGGHTAEHLAWWTDYFPQNGTWMPACGDEWPDEYCGWCFWAPHSDGDYIGVAINFRLEFVPYPPGQIMIETAYSIFEFTVDIE
jgi:hypothetical protein